MGLQLELGMALDSSIGKVALLATDLPGSLDLNTFSNGLRLSVCLARCRHPVIDGEVSTVPEVLIDEVVNLGMPDSEHWVKQLHDEVLRLIDLERAA